MATVERPSLHCEYCSRQFSRKEHLERHHRIHTNAKPFQCDFCDASFARGDSCQRHIKVHHHEQPRRHLKRQRTAVACDGCRTNKVRCSTDHPPCSRCRRKSIPCTYDRAAQPAAATSEGPSIARDQGPPSVDVHPHVNTSPALDDFHANYAFANDPGHRETDSLLSLGVSASSDMRPSVRFADESLAVAHPAPPDVFTPTPSLAFVPPAGPDSNIAPAMFNQPMAYPDPEISESSFAWPGPGLNSGRDEVFASIFSVSENIATDYNFDLFTDELYRSYGPQSLWENFSFDFPPAQDLALSTPSYHVADPNATEERPQSRRLAAACAKLNELSTATAPSRPPSPRALTEQQLWMRSLAAQPSPKFDRDVLNVFLGLFQHHLSGFFPAFRQLRITRDTRPYLYLAKAAVGGLYCTVAGSLRVVKWFIFNARCLVMTTINTTSSYSPAQKLAVILTYILLELFCYLSGETRDFELVEVWHNEMIQTARDFGFWSPNGDFSEPERLGVIHALYILACYRVVHVQRPPMFHPSPHSAVPSSCRSGPHDESLAADLESIAALGSSDRRHITSGANSIMSLCAISLSASQAIDRVMSPLGGDTADAAPDASEKDPPASVFGSTFFEILLNSWRCSHEQPPSNGAMLLFHLVHLNFYVSLPRLQDLGHQKLQQTLSGPHPPKSVSRLTPGTAITAAERKSCFRTEQDCTKALWHAHRILCVAKDMTSHNREWEHSKKHLVNGGERGRARLMCNSGVDAVGEGNPPEGLTPHFAQSVFLATLCFWCAGSESDGGASRAKELQLGQALIARSTCHIAKIFQNILERLGSA